MVPHGFSTKINECYTCSCGDKKTHIKCFNTCDYGFISKNNNVFRYDYTTSDCIGIKKHNNNILCSDASKIKNVACCIDNNCELNNCKSCMNFGLIELCNECDKDHYFNTYSNNKCHSIDDINNICDFSYKLDNISMTFQCLECFNGTRVFNSLYNRYYCDCKTGFTGDNCDIEYNYLMCSNNGIYNEVNNSCLCDNNHYGDNCEKFEGFICGNGTYKNGICNCKYGYTGINCDISVPCVFGIIVNDKCLCNDRFSGVDCSIPLYKINTHNSFNEISNNCLVGDYNIIYDRCDCNNNWYGSRCELNCLQRCSYNGNICGDYKNCVCDPGWDGVNCNIHLTEINTINNDITIFNTHIITYSIVGLYNSTIIFEILETPVINMMPFKITNVKNVDFLHIIIDLNILLNGSKYYIYPNNNYNLSYYSGDNINISLWEDVDYDYFFYIEEEKNRRDDTLINIHLSTPTTTPTPSHKFINTSISNQNIDTEDKNKEVSDNNIGETDLILISGITISIVFIISGISLFIVKKIINKRRYVNINLDENEVLYNRNPSYNNLILVNGNKKTSLSREPTDIDVNVRKNIFKKEFATKRISIAVKDQLSKEYIGKEYIGKKIKNKVKNSTVRV
jgi:hypothetical protein